MKKNRQKSFIPIKATPVVPSIDDLINEFLDKTDKQNAAQEHFFKTWYDYLKGEREKHREEISEALIVSASANVDANLVRIVDLEYANHPLCTIGSVQGPGRRFNIGKRIRNYSSFHCLYLAEDGETAYAEKFHYNKAQNFGNLSPTDLKLKPQNMTDIAVVGVKVSLTNCLDLRDKENVRSFCEIISRIKPTKQLLDFSKTLGVLRLRTIQVPGELLRSLFHNDFLKFHLLLDMPANSQWFGHYCYEAGIQCIIYPSLRSARGANYAVFIDNLKDSKSTVELSANAPYVAQHNRIINSESFEFFKFANQGIQPH